MELSPLFLSKALDCVTGYAVLFLDPQGRFIGCNSATQQIFGYLEAELLQKDFSCIFNDADVEAGAPPRELARARETGRSEDDRWHVGKDGSRFWASGMMSPITDQGGALLGYIKIVRDLTDKKQAEQERQQAALREQQARLEAEQANRSKDEFLAIISHELRTPLNAMLGWVRILSSEPASAELLQEALEVIERNGVAQSRLIEDILDASRIISGKLRLNLWPVPIQGVISAAVASARHDAEANKITLLQKLDPAIPPVPLDADRFQQVVSNLLSNAIKFTPPGGTVTVEVGKIDESVHVMVSDNGQGMAADFVPTIFERFRQADSSSTRAHSGLGLGLYIVRQLIELHGGTVYALSAGEGKGSTFTVTLPIISARMPIGRSREQLSSADQTVPCPPNNRELRLLIVDDNPDARRLLKAVFDRCEIDATMVASADSALKEIERGRFDLLISDLEMPGEDGYALIRQVRGLEAARGGSIPAIALSANARSEDRQRALRAGYQMHLAKPINPEAVMQAVVTLAGT